MKRANWGSMLRQVANKVSEQVADRFGDQWDNLKNLVVRDVWSVQLSGRPITSLAYINHVLLVAMQSDEGRAENSTLYALDRANGHILWQYHFDNAAISGMEVSSANQQTGFESLLLVSTSSGDRIFGKGQVVAFDQAGNKRWTWQEEDVQRISAPAVSADGLTFCVTANAQVAHFLKVDDGKSISQVQLPASASLARPAYVDGVAYIPCRSPHLLAVTQNGRLLWTYEHPTPSAWLNQTPVVAGQNVCAGSSLGELVAVNRENGRRSWKQQLQASTAPLTDLAHDQERVYAGTGTHIAALEAETGRLVWRTPLPLLLAAQPVVSGNRVAYLTQDYQFFVLESQNGQVTWQYGKPSERKVLISPLLVVSDIKAQGFLFVADALGKVRCISRSVGDTELVIAQQERIQRAEQLEEAERPLEAADIWSSVGQHARAATLYEYGNLWDKAAAQWEKAGEFLRQAQALEAYARDLEDSDAAEEELAQAWEHAAEVLGKEGEHEAAEVCSRYAARYRHWPIIKVNIDHPTLVQEEWNQIQVEMQNDGYGPARHVVVEASGNQFEFKQDQTQRFPTIREGRGFVERLNLKPLEVGKSVPLRITLKFLTDDGQRHTQTKTLQVAIAKTRKTREISRNEDIFTQREQTASHRIPDIMDLVKDLNRSFNRNEIEGLCFELQVDPEQLPVKDMSRAQLIFQMVFLLQRQNRIPELLELCREKRPHIDWAWQEGSAP